jgi:short-subunit dehydrogenase
MRDAPVVIITGASGGIGEATARLFGARGWAVVLAARSAEGLQQVTDAIRADGGTALPVPTDVTKPVDRTRLVSATLEAFGRVDALINNAGMGLSGTIETLDLGDLEYVMQLNVLAPVALMQAVVRAMRRKTGERPQTGERRQTGERPQTDEHRQFGVRWLTDLIGCRKRTWRGAIVNVSSMIEGLPVPYVSGYGASKSALAYFSDAAAIELDRDDIAVVKVTPGLIATGFERNILVSGQGASLEQLVAQAGLLRALPAERVAENIWQAVQTGRRPRTQPWRDRAMVVLGRRMPRAANAILKLAAKRYILPSGEPAQANIRGDLRDLGLRVGAAAVVVATVVSGAWLWIRACRRPSANAHIP